MESTYTSAQVAVEETHTTLFSVVTRGPIILNFMVYDNGDGERPFFPLIFYVNGIRGVLPLELTAGEHVFELLGEPFSGIGLKLIGSEMHNVERITVGAVAELQSSSPGYYEDDGHPDYNPLVQFALNGSEYWDRLNKQRYKKSENTWLQLAS